MTGRDRAVGAPSPPTHPVCCDADDESFSASPCARRNFACCQPWCVHFEQAAPPLTDEVVYEEGGEQVVIRRRQAAPPLDRELAAIYLAAAMKECGYTADESDATAILDYIEADNNAGLSRLGSAPSRSDL